MPKKDSYHHQHRYSIRVQSSLIVALLLLIAAFNFWPILNPSLDEKIYNTAGQEVIAMEEIQPTKQQARKPPPPTPLLPVVVPDDVVLDDEFEIDEPLLDLDADGVDDGLPDLPAAGAASEAPQTGPKPLRFVEPEYTRAARRNKVRAEVIVQVLVDERGRVSEATILERFLLARNGDERTMVSTLEYGLEESALSAAQRWMFQPARQNGQPVKSYTTLTFSFGV